MNCEYLGFLLSFLSSIDVTEVQLFIITMYLLAAAGGAAFWQSPVSLIGAHPHIHTHTHSDKCALSFESGLLRVMHF